MLSSNYEGLVNGNIKQPTKRVTITTPNGGTGTWFIDKFCDNFDMCIDFLSSVMQKNDQGFTISITKCARVMPESIVLSDDSLAYIISDDLFVQDNDGKLMSNNSETIARVALECIRNDAYREFIIGDFDSREETEARTRVKNNLLKMISLAEGI